LIKAVLALACQLCTGGHKAEGQRNCSWKMAGVFYWF